MRTIPALAIVFAGTLLGIIGCKVTPAAADPLGKALGTTVDADAAFSPDPMRKVFAAVLPTPAVRGSFTRFYGRSVPVTNANPLVLPHAAEPRVGRHVLVDWTTTPTTPPASPSRKVWLLISTKPTAPISMAPFGAPRSWLLVLPQWTIQPTPNAILTQNGGTVSLDWVPDASLAGSTWYLQLVVEAPSVPYGYLFSPMLRITLGS